MPLSKIKEEILKEFNDKFPEFKGVGSQYPIFAENPNRNHIKAFLSASITKACEEMMEENNRLIDIINLILPLAKGYVAKNQVGSNQKYIEIAEEIIAKKQEEFFKK
mgnify:CR=1 FL=1